jgi:hypothetical protein
VATVIKAERKAQIPFAMIPFLFGVQQIVEGMLWLTFRFDDQLLNVTMTYLFVLFSHILWPIFLPFSIGLMETVAWRKKVISAFQITGIAVGLYLLYFIVRYPVASEVHGHMVYVLPYVKEQPVLEFYLAATCVAPLFSSHRIIKIFGVLALLLFMVAYWYYTVAFFSVWCFFAAVLSGVVYLHFKFGNGRDNIKTQLNS